jgi:aminoglycoside phosphotransferase (APT) family kinase protein
MNNSFGISGNNLERVGNSIVKKYPHNPNLLRRELFALQSLKSLRVPEVLDSENSNELHLKYIDGINGKQAIESGFAKEVLSEMGNFLRELQNIDISTVSRHIPGDGSVICHGDFAHYNSIMSIESSNLIAIVDWEVCCIGDPVMDIAWCEFQFLRQFPNQKWVLQHLFKGFGSTPTFEEREKSVQDRLKYLQKNSYNE